jgi:hypothetical protein
MNHQLSRIIPRTTSPDAASRLGQWSDGARHGARFTVLVSVTCQHLPQVFDHTNACFS